MVALAVPGDEVPVVRRENLSTGGLVTIVAVSDNLRGETQNLIHRGIIDVSLCRGMLAWAFTLWSNHLRDYCKCQEQRPQRLKR